MSVNIRKSYYKMSASEFHAYLENVKSDPATIHLLKGEKQAFFYAEDPDINMQLMDLHHAQREFDDAISFFSAFTRKQLIQSFMIEEIRSTQEIENIHSTRHDIFTLMKNVSGSGKHVASIVRSYEMLLGGNAVAVNDLQSIRACYDQLMKNAYEDKQDKPDGRLFRKDPVRVFDGIKKVHAGLYPEANIISGMEEMVKLYQSTSMDLYLRLFLSHFLLESIHPFYDGNGRLGRYLMSSAMYGQEKSYAAFCIASSIHKNKSKYYKAFAEAEDVHAYGCLNGFVAGMCRLLTDGLKERTEYLEKIAEEIIHAELPAQSDWTVSERKIYRFLREIGLVTYFGVTNGEIQEETGCSKRTVISTLKKFRETGLLEETKIGKFKYEKLK